MRDELPSMTLFLGIDHARIAVADRPHTCKTERPHSALGCLPPGVFVTQPTAMGDPLRATAQTSTKDSGPSRMRIGGHRSHHDVLASTLDRV